MRRNSALGAVVVALVLLSACGVARETPDVASRFGLVLSPVSEIVDTDLSANRVISLPCIPSRSDPVGVWITVRVIEAEVHDETFTISMQETDARLGSHPSGCRNPKALPAQSIFLLDGEEKAVFAHAQATNNGVTTLDFSLVGLSPQDLDVVILPTIEFEKGDGVRQTTIFGLMGRYSMV